MPLSLGIASGAGSLKDVTEPELLGYRVNYIPNPSFEVNSNGWTEFNNSIFSLSGTESFSGTSSLEVVSTSQSGVETASRIPFLGGEGNYQISAYVKLADGNAEANYYLRYLQYETLESTSTVTSATIGIQSLAATGSWVRLSGVMPKNAIAGYFIIRIATQSSTVGDTFYLDSVMVEKADALGDYFDGSTAGGFWTGTPHESYSGGTPY